MDRQRVFDLDAVLRQRERWPGRQDLRPHRRAFVADQIQSPVLANALVRVGFGLDESNEQFPSESVRGSLVQRGHKALDIWRAVVLRHALVALDRPLPFPREGWADAVTWVAQNPEDVGARLRACDRALHEAGKVLLVVFDALDRLAGTWESVRQLMQDALQLGLHCRSLQAIRLKLFLRPDMEEDEVVWQFRDSSKLRHAKVELRWPPMDLYGLVLMYLANKGDYGPVFREFVTRLVSEEWAETSGVFQPPRGLLGDDKLRPVIEELAVLYRTADNRLNMPDIFRVGFGIKRKGGVKLPR